jgi:lysophospholipase
VTACLTALLLDGTATEVPFHRHLAQGPGGRGVVAAHADDVRLRAVAWGRERGEGTVLLFNGRTEYAEKYGRVAADLRPRATPR